MGKDSVTEEVTIGACGPGYALVIGVTPEPVGGRSTCVYALEP